MYKLAYMYMTLPVKLHRHDFTCTITQTCYMYIAYIDKYMYMYIVYIHVQVDCTTLHVQECINEYYMYTYCTCMYLYSVLAYVLYTALSIYKFIRTCIVY